MDLEADSWIVDALLTLMQQGCSSAAVGALGNSNLRTDRYRISNQDRASADVVSDTTKYPRGVLDRGCVLRAGMVVAVVTAAGYPGKPERYAARFRGLLERMKDIKAPKEARALSRPIPCRNRSLLLVLGPSPNYPPTHSLTDLFLPLDAALRLADRRRAQVTDRFLCMGGECNYLFRVTVSGAGARRNGSFGVGLRGVSLELRQSLTGSPAGALR